MEETLHSPAVNRFFRATTVLTALGTMTARGLRPDSQLFGATVVAGRNTDELALTYDDGPNDRSTPELLEVLAKHGQRATFFLIGKFARQRPDLVREIHAGGHLVGNHTMTHPFLPAKSASAIEQELSRCNMLLEDILGEPVQFFRPPYGGRRPAVLRIAKQLGLTAVLWNVQGNDWEPLGVTGILKRMERDLVRVRRQGRGANILLHDGFDERMGFDRTDSVLATDILLGRAASEGRSVVTVDTWRGVHALEAKAASGNPLRWGGSFRT